MDLETARLRLRCYRESDLSDLVALIGNWEVARWVSSVPHPYTEAHGQQWITSVQHEHTAANPRRFAVALKDDDHLIGGGGLDGKIPGDVSGDSVLGYWLGQPYWGNGYGREAVAALIQYAFRTLAAKVVSAYTDPDNVASQKILRHCGLEKVGEVELANSTRNGARRIPLFRTPAGMLQFEFGGEQRPAKAHNLHMRPALHIAPLLALPADIEELRIEAAGEGFRFVDKLITEWHSGTNRFAQAGEIFLGACRSDELIAIGGLNRDPYAGQAWIGRLRHLYVRKSERRSGVGSTLVRQLLRHAEGIFHLVRLRTGTQEAAAFYVGLGFCPVQDKAATHVMLRRQSLGPSVQNLDLCSEGSSDLERRFASGGLSQLRANTRRIRT